MRTFLPGEEVVCVSSKWHRLFDGVSISYGPQKNELYIVGHIFSVVDGHEYISLEGYDQHLFNQKGFAPVLTNKQLEEQLHLINYPA